jgi:hypothetical protein
LLWKRQELGEDALEFRTERCHHASRYYESPRVCHSETAELESGARVSRVERGAGCCAGGSYVGLRTSLTIE